MQLLLRYANCTLGWCVACAEADRRTRRVPRHVQIVINHAKLGTRYHTSYTGSIPVARPEAEPSLRTDQLELREALNRRVEVLHHRSTQIGFA